MEDTIASIQRDEAHSPFMLERLYSPDSKGWSLRKSVRERPGELGGRAPPHPRFSERSRHRLFINFSKKIKWSPNFLSDTRFGEVPWEGAFGGGNELLRLWASALLSHLADVQRCSGRTSTT